MYGRTGMISRTVILLTACFVLGVTYWKGMTIWRIIQYSYWWSPLISGYQYIISIWSPYFIPTIYLTIHHDSHCASMNIHGIHSTNISQSLPSVLSFDGMEKLILAWKNSPDCSQLKDGRRKKKQTNSKILWLAGLLSHCWYLELINTYTHLFLQHFSSCIYTSIQHYLIKKNTRNRKHMCPKKKNLCSYAKLMWLSINSAWILKEDR